MRLEFDFNDDWMVDPRELAAKLGTSADDLRRLKKLGLVVSRVERGSEEDEGRSRVTVRTERAAWEGLFDETGRLISDRRF